MKKRILAVTLIIVMVMLLLPACADVQEKETVGDTKDDME